MKFRLFGGLDCSDYLLAQLNAVAMMTDVEAVEQIAEASLSVLRRSMKSSTDSSGSVQDLMGELFALESIAAMPQDDATKVVVSIYAVVENIVRFNVPADAAANELTMIGLPKEIADAIVHVVCPKVESLRAVQAAEHVPMRQGLSLDPANVSVWRNADDDDTESHTVRVEFAVHPRGTDGAKAHALTLDATPEKLKALLSELVTAREALRAAGPHEI